jgi:hypothetical protein
MLRMLRGRCMLYNLLSTTLLCFRNGYPASLMCGTGVVPV